MRTNIDLDDKLLKEAFKLSDKETKKDLIHEALEVFIKVKSRKDIRDLKGRMAFRKGYDHKKLRAG